MNIIEKIEKSQIEKIQADRNFPEFNPGDTIKVDVKVIEGTRENSLDPYAIMRTMYLQRRARLIANEESEDTAIYDIDIDVMLLD